MSSSTTSVNIKDVLETAVSENQISAQVAQDIDERMDDIALAGCQGVDIEDLDSEENTLVTVIIDASGSMSSDHLSVIDSYNEHFLTPLIGSKTAESILVSTWIFSQPFGSGGGNNCRLRHGFMPVSQCPKLDSSAYDPDGATPLYEAAHLGMTGLLAYGQTLRQGGARVKNIVVVFSDGGENASARKYTSAACKRIAADLLAQETSVLAYAFFGDEHEGDGYAKELGFPPQHRITAGMSDKEIRRLFKEVSASVISTSQAQISTNMSANPFFNAP